MNNMEQQKRKMEDWNEKLREHKGAFLPKNIARMENTEHYEMFMEDYGAMPFRVDSEIAKKLHNELVEDYSKGRKKHDADGGELISYSSKYQGFNKYPNHKGSKDGTTAKKNQKAATTSIRGRDLRAVRYSLDSFNIIMGDVEKLTGLAIVKMDILRQSKTGKDGKREALFSYHIDTEEVMSAVVTATIILTEMDTSMQILGF